MSNRGKIVDRQGVEWSAQALFVAREHTGNRVDRPGVQWPHPGATRTLTGCCEKGTEWVHHMIGVVVPAMVSPVGTLVVRTLPE